MRKKIAVRLLLITSMIWWSVSAYATYNATITGTVNTITQFGTALQFGPETIQFDLTNQPAIGCPQGNHFVFSPNTVTDAQTRKNMLAILLHAKATGNQVEVAYDSTGAYCDQGYPAVYYIVEMP